MKKYAPLLIGWMMLSSVPLFAEPVEDNTFRGHDYARKAAHDKAAESERLLLEKLDALQTLMHKKTNPERSEHDAVALDRLLIDQRSWMEYRASHCGLKSYVYAYPADSRLSQSEYNACKLEMNLERIQFLDEIKQEYAW